MRRFWAFLWDFGKWVLASWSEKRRRRPGKRRRGSWWWSRTRASGSLLLGFEGDLCWRTGIELGARQKKKKKKKSGDSER